LKLGVISCYYGLTTGVSGAITFPYNGYKRNGVSGFLKGTLKGTTGLIIKPISGVLDLTANTSLGIKNTFTYFEVKPNKTKIRFPRVFYQQQRFIKPYDFEASEVFHLILKEDKS